MTRFQRPLSCFVLALLAFGLLASPGHAWPKKKEKGPDIENYEPPDENAFELQCEPIRRKILDLNEKVPKYAHIFIVPQREILMARHRDCKQRIMDQEFQYLKHVDIRNPSLPPLDVDEENPPSQAPVQKP